MKTGKFTAGLTVLVYIMYIQITGVWSILLYAILFSISYIVIISLFPNSYLALVNTLLNKEAILEAFRMDRWRYVICFMYFLASLLLAFASYINIHNVLDRGCYSWGGLVIIGLVIVYVIFPVYGLSVVTSRNRYRLLWRTYLPVTILLIVWIIHLSLFPDFAGNCYYD